ncbi:FHA domain-containing protein [Saccharothrix sp. ST-888]|uniref:FHA domain-containing protein n=1 Tax=Saccharothrix sp. ST-888 TaxID=1427391 RepID=UPI000B01A4D9|nr:FHA domain-containing protein [Saccharothrix sp. ST-888]
MPEIDRQGLDEQKGPGEMQIRLTVLRPRSGSAAAGSATDVLVTAPVGTALGTVAGALAGAVGVRGPRSATHVHLYAGDQRLDDQALLGHPPLLDGAVLALNEPDPDADEPVGGTAPELRIVGGPDAGGVHRLHGEEIRVGRSSQADVPLDDPDVSRLHLSLHLSPDGRVTVRDLGSTNGTTVDGRFLRGAAADLPDGGLVRLGESTLQVARPDGTAHPDLGDISGSPRQPVADGQGRLQLAPAPPAKPHPAEPPVPAAAEPPSPGGRARALLSRALGHSAAPEPQPSAAQQHTAARLRQTAAQRERWPDPAGLLLTALGTGPRLWERGPAHPDALALRLGTADRPGGPGTAPGAVLPAVPVTVDLRSAGSLGLTGPRARLLGLARAAVAQLAALHPPSVLNLVLVSADEASAADWSWALWLPHLRPAHGQDCRLLVGFGPEQTEARLTELTARTGFDSAAAPPATVLLVDGDPGSPAARHALELLLARRRAGGGTSDAGGWGGGTSQPPGWGKVFPICLAERPDDLPPGLGATAHITGEVATQLTVSRPAQGGRETVTDVSLDAVSAAWAERLARVLAPLTETSPASRGPLPDALRLLDLLRLDTVTPAKLSARWAALPSSPGTATALLGTTRDDHCTIDLADPDLAGPPSFAGAEPVGPHLIVGGARGSGKTELLRTLIASLAVSERPERLRITVVEGRGSAGPDDPSSLRSCTDLPHVTDHLDAAADPRQALLTAESLLDELDRREAVLGDLDFTSWHTTRALGGTPGAAALVTAGSAGPAGAVTRTAGPRTGADVRPAAPARLVVVVDDYDALLAPTSPAGRPLARALAAVAQRGGRLGVHLAVSTGSPEDTAGTEVDEVAQLRIALRTADPADSDLLIHLGDAAALAEDTPGRGYLRRPDGGVTAFQAARVSGRIPRTATLRPTVVAIDPAQLGAPPTRRPVRELGNGPTDLALLASALQRAATTP